jgi:hypothetical protein
MVADPLSLLSALGSGLRLLTGGQAARSEPIDSASFADLLKRAEGGEIESGLPISVARGVDAGLTEEQLVELARLADQAEAAGLKSVMVLVQESAGDGEGADDGGDTAGGVRGLLLDVQGRTITGVAEPTQKVIRGVDGVLRLGASDEADRGPAPLPSAGLYAR